MPAGFIGVPFAEALQAQHIRRRARQHVEFEIQIREGDVHALLQLGVVPGVVGVEVGAEGVLVGPDVFQAGEEGVGPLHVVRDGDLGRAGVAQAEEGAQHDLRVVAVDGSFVVRAINDGVDGGDASGAVAGDALLGRVVDGPFR